MDCFWEEWLNTIGAKLTFSFPSGVWYPKMGPDRKPGPGSESTEMGTPRSL